MGLWAVAAGCTATGDKSDIIQAILAERATHLAGSDQRRIAGLLMRAEDSSGVDSLLLLAVMEEESTYRVRARSPRGAIGLMQIRPRTARHVAERTGIAWRTTEDLYDPARNVRLGAAYLAELRELFGSWDLALTAYNNGPRAARQARRRGAAPSSGYARRVLQRHERFRRRLDEAKQAPSPAGGDPAFFAPPWTAICTMIDLS
jgi:soluble lytic murein transglycosylase-like protein